MINVINNDSKLTYLGAEFETECATFRPASTGRTLCFKLRSKVS